MRSLCSNYPEVDGIFVHFRLPGRGQGKCWCRVKTVVSLLWRNFRMSLLDALKRLTSIVLSLPCGCLDHIGFGSFLQGSTRLFSDENEKALQDALGRLGPLWDALGTLWCALGRAPPSRAHPKWGQIGPTSNSNAEKQRRNRNNLTGSISKFDGRFKVMCFRFSVIGFYAFSRNPCV